MIDASTDRSGSWSQATIGSVTRPTIDTSHRCDLGHVKTGSLNPIRITERLRFRRSWNSYENQNGEQRFEITKADARHQQKMARIMKIKAREVVA